MPLGKTLAKADLDQIENLDSIPAAGGISTSIGMALALRTAL